jgi:hypothetical protein
MFVGPAVSQPEQVRDGAVTGLSAEESRERSLRRVKVA